MLNNDELACVYSALILQDDEIAVTVSIDGFFLRVSVSLAR